MNATWLSRANYCGERKMDIASKFHFDITQRLKERQMPGKDLPVTIVDSIKRW
jgi:hypothetical protein